MKFFLLSCFFVVLSTAMYATDASTRATPASIKPAAMRNPEASSSDAVLPASNSAGYGVAADPATLAVSTPIVVMHENHDKVIVKKMSFFAKLRALKTLLREVKAYKKELKRSSSEATATIEPAVLSTDAGSSGINISNRQYLIFGAISLGLLLLGLLIIGGAGAFFWVVGAIGLVTLLVLYLIQHV